MSLNFGPYTVETSNEEKILFPEAEITKLDLIKYYTEMADHILPHTKDRPVTMHRFPDGIDGKDFFQKEASNYFPEWIDTEEVKKENGKVKMVIINNKATLAYLANQACIIPHIWLSKKDKINFPDKIIFDLDPPEDNFQLVIEGAKQLKKILEEELSLNSFVMTTGSKGLHVIVPIKRNHPFDWVREFAVDISNYMVNLDAESYTTEIRKEKRDGRLFIDYLRNSYAQTSVTPYAVRALKDAPVATPLAWDELDDHDLHSRKYTVSNISKRVQKQADPWENFFRLGKDLEKPRSKLNNFLNI